MGTFDQIKKDIIDAIKAGQESGTSAYDTEAEVIRTSGSIAWVHIPGGVDETPVKMTIHSEPGDKVQVRVSGGSAWLVGNETAPPTDDTTAIEAKLKSLEADLNAKKAMQSAEDAALLAQTNAARMAEAVIAINSDIENLQDQIDGNITTWYYAYAPTLSNEPASTWTTTEEKNNHIGDIFYNSETGYSYRFMLNGSNYEWVRISDEDISAALEAASAAQDTADHKRRVFVARPTVPYDKGDLWCVGSSGDILTCTNAKTSSQSYAASDWSKLNKYTDDTVANAAAQAAASAQQSADSAAEAAQTAWNHADEANTAAQAAASAAESAQSSADSALQSASTANVAANSALTQLSVVEDVVDVLNWVSEHGSYKLTADTTVVEGKYYFTRSGTSPNYTYTVVTNPTGNPKSKGYYELDSVDEAVSNYISSHLALTNQGLWVINDNSAYKILLASDGMKVYDGSGNLVSSFGESIIFSSTRPQTIGNESSYVKFYKDGSTWKIAVVADSISLGSNAVATETYADGKASTAESNAKSYADSVAGTAESNAKAYADTAAGGANAREQLIYISKATGTTSVSAETTWVTDATGNQNVWTTKRPEYSQDYPVLFVATQRQTVAQSSGTTCTCTTPIIDDTITVIDGGNIITGTVTANQLDANSINASKILTVGAFQESEQANILNSNIAVPTVNLLPSIYYREYVSGKKWTSNGITFVVNNDGSVTASGTATADASYTLNEYKDSYAVPIMHIDNSKNYTLSGCPSGGSSTTYYLIGCCRADATSGTASNNYYDYGNGRTFKPGTEWIGFYIVIKKNYAIPEGGLTFYPQFEVGETANPYISTHQGSGALRDTIDNIQVGGRNLLRHTKDFAESTYTSTCTFEKDAEGITVITFPAYTGSVGWHGVTLHPNIPYALIRNKTVTLSFWYRSDSWTLASGGHNYPLPSFEILANATDNPSGTARLKYQTIYDSTVPAPTTEWQRFVRSYNITDSFFTAGSGTVTEDRYFTIQMFQHNLSHLQYKKIQLEIGNKVTDWTPATEDVEDNINNLGLSGKNLLTGTNTVTAITSTGTHDNRTWRKGGDGTGTITHIDVEDAPYNVIKNGWKFDVTSVKTTNYGNGLLVAQNAANVVAGKTYTMSCYAKGTGTLYMFCGISSYVPSDGSGKITVTSSWQKYYATFTAPSNAAVVNANGTNVFFGASGTNISLSICGMMLEEGDAATLWSPAPEDITSEEQRIYYRSSVSTKPNGNGLPTAWVTKNTNKWNSVATNADGWSKKVTPISDGKASGVTKYLYLFTCTQSRSISGEVTYSEILLDDSTTVIDGGNIITGSVKANQIDVNNLFAQDITATGTIAGAKLIGAKGTFTRGFDVDILFDMTHGNIIDDKSEAEDAWERKYIRMDRDSVAMGFATDDGEGGETENNFFRSYRDPAHPTMTTLTLASVYLQLYGMYIQMQGNASLTGSLDVTGNATVLGHKMVYEAGDVVVATGIFAGHLTGSSKQIQFFVPLPKPRTPGIKCAISGNWMIRHVGGGYILYGATLQSIGTVSASAYETGVFVTVALNSAVSVTNNTPVSVNGTSNAKITFST